MKKKFIYVNSAEMNMMAVMDLEDFVHIYAKCIIYLHNLQKFVKKSVYYVPDLMLLYIGS